METQVELREARVATIPLQPRGVRQGPSNERLAALWKELTTGCWRIVADFSDRTHHYLELAPTAAPPLSSRELARWRPILFGNAQKVVAASAGCSCSTVASSAARCLKVIGLHCTAKDAPMLVVMMAHASDSLDFPTARVWRSARLDGSVVISVARPDLRLAEVLSPSELDVVRLRVDALSHGQIAALRSTAPRTVANQLASVYAKLGVSGRLELLAALVQGTWRRDCSLRRMHPKRPAAA